MNVTDWIRESSKYMALVRPDIYDVYRASEDLISWMDELRTEREWDEQSSKSMGGFILTRLVEDDGVEEFILSRFISSVALFDPEEECLVLGGVPEINLPLPTLDDEDDV